MQFIIVIFEYHFVLCKKFNCKILSIWVYSDYDINDKKFMNCTKSKKLIDFNKIMTVFWNRITMIFSTFVSYFYSSYTAIVKRNLSLLQSDAH